MDSICVLAIDVGTTGTKVGVFDLEGNLLGRASRSYPLHSPHPGWVEQDPELWWDAILSALAETLRCVRTDQLKAVSVVGQNPTLVCLDQAGKAVRPAITWGDRRSVAEANELGEKVGRKMDASLNIPKMKWLKKNEPDSFSRTATFLQSFDFVNYRLSGERCAVSPVPPWSPWTRGDMEAADLPPELVPRQVKNIGDLVGTVTPACARESGLPEGLPLIAGLVDGMAACLGTGTLKAAELYFGSGTTSGVNLCWPEAVTDPDSRFGPIPHPLGNRWLLGGPTSTGGKFLEWFAQSVCRETVEDLCEAISCAPAKDDKVICLPYLLGERTPIFDPLARAVFFGLTQGHTRVEMGKAVMESVAFAVRDVTDILSEAGLEITVLRTGGGGAQSSLWNQIKCDVLGKPLLVPKVTDSSLLGAGIAAAWGAGFYQSGDQATTSMVQIGRTYDPDLERHRRYTDLFQLYRRLYRHLKDDFRFLASLQDIENS